MSMLWGKFRGKVDSVSTSIHGMSISRTEKDRGEDDTVISRALYRYYGSATPDWLLASAPPPSSNTSSPTTSNAPREQPTYSPRPLQSRSTTDFSHIYSRQSISRNSISSDRRPSQSPVPPPAQGEIQGVAASQDQQQQADRKKFSRLRHANW